MGNTQTPTTFSGLVDHLLSLIDMIIPALFAVVFLFLIWKIFDAWVIHADDTKKIEEGKQIALTAVIVFVIMLIIWGVVALIRRSIFGN
ncbi:MAG: hypothetical protein UZ19_OD1000986 [Parcubacteria bacterium OLB19]|nr:MAG: hypothetical protein UZ19_OD1000986 [Parcubacteria bacterium OLB19]